MYINICRYYYYCYYYYYNDNYRYYYYGTLYKPNKNHSKLTGFINFLQMVL
jgi:hypothetical protein